MKKLLRISGVTLCSLTILLIYSCQKDSPPPTLSIIATTAISAITQTSAVSGGNITSDGGASVIARGVCWSTTANPTTTDAKSVDGTGTGQFVSSLSGLTAGTAYHIRAYATNSVGTAYGDDKTFSTLGQAPSCITQPASNVSTNGATLNGTVNANDLSTIVTFEYGITTSYGSSATSTQSPVTGITDTNVSADITGITSSTTYHYRIKAVNSLGTTYGLDVTFITPSSTSVTDVDGNIYNTVTIGTQVWMKENLQTTKYNNNTPIPLVTDPTAWATLTTPGYSWYKNDTATYKATYGALYNWYAVDAASNGGKNVCPTGWHVPTDVEWTTLTTYLGGESVAGGTLKETGTTHWASPNTGATDEMGFTALPGGNRLITGSYYGLGIYIYFWSSMEYETSDAWSRSLYFDNTNITSYFDRKNNGFYVRCVKDF